MKLTEANIFDQEIRLSAGEVHVLGPALTLERCHVSSACNGREIVIAGLTMIGGSFAQVTPLKDFQLEYAHFHGVNFSGDFIGCDFGSWDVAERSSYADCDFTAAILDGCRFLNCDLTSIKLPGWPCFVIVHPHAAATYVSQRSWPAQVGALMNIYTDVDPACVAVCANANRIAKKSGTTLPELREALSPVPGIRLSD